MKPYSHAIYHPSSFNMMFHIYGCFNYSISVFQDVEHYEVGYLSLMLHMDAHGFIYRFNKKHGHHPIKLIENFKPFTQESI